MVLLVLRSLQKDLVKSVDFNEYIVDIEFFNIIYLKEGLNRFIDFTRGYQ